MSKKKGQHLSDKTQYASYKNAGSYSKNKRAKIERHIAKFPNDEKAKESLKSVRATPPRKPSANTVWSRNTTELAQLYRKTGQNGKLALIDKEDHSNQ